MSEGRQSHVLGFSIHREDHPTAYFRFSGQNCEEARLIGQAARNYCEPHDSENGFSSSLKSFFDGTLYLHWNEYLRPSGKTFGFLGKAALLRLPPGAQYNRIARATFAAPNDAPSYNNLIPEEIFELQSLLIDLSNILRRLREICKIVQPDAINMTSYGSEIADTLVVSCTTLEGSLRSILSANSPKLENADRLTTRNYVRLAAPLRLSEYKVVFRDFPWLSAITPFENWSATAPTKSLSWYDAYNAVKHDRYKNRTFGNLGYCLCAVAAVYVVICAQFGYGAVQHRYRDVSEALVLSQVPKWLPSELYLSPLHRTENDNHWYRVQLFD